MSHLVISLSCSCGQVFKPERSSGDEQCPSCGKMVRRPPEPTLEELNHSIRLAEAHVAYLKDLLQPGRLERLVDDELEQISYHKSLIDRYQRNHQKAPADIDTYNEWLGSLLEQRMVLVTRNQQAARSPRESKPKQTDAQKLRSRLGDDVFNKLVSALGSEDKVVAAMKA